jgi:predicted NAD/FAD-binding protein
MHMEIEGGARNYVQALARDLTRTTVRLSAPLVRVLDANGFLEVRTADGSSQTFDAVVIATNATQAAEVLPELHHASDACDALRRIRHFSTRIAIHGDLRWMPRDRRHWSVVNIRSDGRYSHTTSWKPWRGQPPVFKSWVTYSSALPDPLYSLVTYQHPWVDSAYFQTQQQIRAMQGQKGVWFAGMYTHDIDCHESAVQSAVRVARALSPKSSRLTALTNGVDS